MTVTKPLSHLATRFVDAYLADPRRNGTAAYLSVSPESTRGSASVMARKWLMDARVQFMIQRREQELADASPLTVDLVRQHLAEIVKADPRDLIDYRRGACRYCHGKDHQYQRTPQEVREAVKEYKVLHKTDDPLCLLFDAQGGVGFNPNKDPHPDCPECFGRGEGYTYAKDLRLIPASAARLFSTIEETQHGIKIKVRSQDKTLEMAMRHLGMHTDPDQGDDTPPAATVQFVQQDASKGDA